MKGTVSGSGQWCITGIYSDSMNSIRSKTRRMFRSRGGGQNVSSQGGFRRQFANGYCMRVDGKMKALGVSFRGTVPLANFLGSLTIAPTCASPGIAKFISSCPIQVSFSSFKSLLLRQAKRFLTRFRQVCRTFETLFQSGISRDIKKPGHDSGRRSRCFRIDDTKL